MARFEADMPKKEETKRVEAHLMPDKYEALKAIAEEKQWSVKKMAENIILWYLDSVKPKGKKQ